MRVEQRDERAAPEVFDWRRRQLLAAGFGRVLATRIAGRDAYDLHALIELVEQGCPPQLAVRILALLDDEAKF